MDRRRPKKSNRKRNKHFDHNETIISPLVGRINPTFLNRKYTFAQDTDNSFYRVVSMALTGTEAMYEEFRSLLVTFIDIFRNLDFRWREQNPNAVLKKIEAGGCACMDVVLQSLATLLDCHVYLYGCFCGSNYTWKRYDSLFPENSSFRWMQKRYRAPRHLIFLKSKNHKFAWACNVFPHLDLPLPTREWGWCWTPDRQLILVHFNRFIFL